MEKVFFRLLEIIYRKSPSIHLELRPPSWTMAAKFQFLAISVKTVDLTKITALYIFIHNKIFYKTCSMYIFSTGFYFHDILSFVKTLYSELILKWSYLLSFGSETAFFFPFIAVFSKWLAYFMFFSHSRINYRNGGNHISRWIMPTFECIDPWTQKITFLKPGCGKVPARHYNSSDLQASLGPLKDYILFIHAASGCDTVSSFFGQGKHKLLTLLQKKEGLRKHVEIFNSKTSTHQSVADEEEKLLIELYKGS